MKSKSRFHPVKLFLLFAVIAIIALIIMLFLTQTTNRIKGSQSDTTTQDTTTPPPNVTIIIDAGHGGEDGGAVGVNGVYEKDLNLDIATKLAAMLTEKNITVVMTRTEDLMLYDINDTSTKKKTQDLVNRLKIATQYDNAVFVSIHMNSFPVEKYSGAQVYYSKNNPDSARLATEIQTAIKILQPENDRQTKIANNSIYLLDRLNCPAVIAECGFLTNYAECEKLSTDTYRTQIAEALFDAICKYVEEVNETS